MMTLTVFRCFHYRDLEPESPILMGHFTFALCARSAIMTEWRNPNSKFQKGVFFFRVENPGLTDKNVSGILYAREIGVI